MAAFESVPILIPVTAVSACLVVVVNLPQIAFPELLAHHRDSKPSFEIYEIEDAFLRTA